ncbi:hypothetical protein Y032_0703g1671 [Ancylostoma ceylanicum]|uniref:Uncharacterized protein n=1 Tax=Ancylostoma ceylanicum TaxID=53326 RepID=A0A016WHA7_9BILA|nr:hypothetical protein Y032_0703g1671 [Ancylostoma ceylanicum]
MPRPSLYRLHPLSKTAYIGGSLAVAFALSVPRSQCADDDRTRIQLDRSMMVVQELADSTVRRGIYCFMMVRRVNCLD